MKKQLKYPTSRRTITKFSYEDYYLALQLYKIYKAESIKEAKLPLNDFRRPLPKRELLIISFKNQFTNYLKAAKERTKKMGLSVSAKASLLLKIKTYFSQPAAEDLF